MQLLQDVSQKAIKSGARLEPFSVAKFSINLGLYTHLADLIQSLSVRGLLLAG